MTYRELMLHLSSLPGIKLDDEILFFPAGKGWTYSVDRVEHSKMFPIIRLKGRQRNKQGGPVKR